MIGKATFFLNSFTSDIFSACKIKEMKPTLLDHNPCEKRELYREPSSRRAQETGCVRLLPLEFCEIITRHHPITA
jgi:hypothetical protein